MHTHIYFESNLLVIKKKGGGDFKSGILASNDNVCTSTNVVNRPGPVHSSSVIKVHNFRAGAGTHNNSLHQEKGIKKEKKPKKTEKAITLWISASNHIVSFPSEKASWHWREGELTSLGNLSSAEFTCRQLQREGEMGKGVSVPRTPTPTLFTRPYWQTESTDNPCCITDSTRTNHTLIGLCSAIL